MTRLRVAWIAGASGHPLPFGYATAMLVLAWKAGRRARREIEGREPARKVRKVRRFPAPGGQRRAGLARPHRLA